MSLKKLVVDANAFIKCYPLEELSQQIYTIPDVIKELRDAATRKRLEFTSYELILEEPSAESIKRASDFSKKTGDYASLSLVDIKLIALAIEIQESECSPVEFIESEVKTVFGSGGTKKSSDNTNICNNTLPIGFHMPHVDLGKYNNHFKDFSYAVGYTFSDNDIKLYSKIEGIMLGDQMIYLKRWKSHIEELLKGLVNTSNSHDLETIELNVDLKEDEVSEESAESGVEESESELSEEDESSDGGGWITPSNYKPRVQAEATLKSSVGLLSTDFALQNVILHTNISLISPYGQRITTLRSYVLRCYACFETTTQFERQFCPRCGNKTLRKVSVSVQDGNVKLHFSKRFTITPRGKKFSLPTPKGGKYCANPILTEDQHVTEIRRSKKAVAREIGPFAMKDVSTRSFMVQGQSSHYWDKRNPNEVKRGKGQR